MVFGSACGPRTVSLSLTLCDFCACLTSILKTHCLTHACIFNSPGIVPTRVFILTCICSFCRNVMSTEAPIESCVTETSSSVCRNLKTQTSGDAQTDLPSSKHWREEQETGSLKAASSTKHLSALISTDTEMKGGIYPTGPRLAIALLTFMF